MSIKIDNVILKGPYPIKRWNPPYSAAVYAIFIKEDLNQPHKYTIIYSDESDNLSDSEFYRSHYRFKCWIKQAGSEDNIYIGIHKMPYASCEDRKKLECYLIDQHKPVCNNRFSNFRIRLNRK